MWEQIEDIKTKKGRSVLYKNPESSHIEEVGFYMPKGSDKDLNIYFSTSDTAKYQQIKKVMMEWGFPAPNDLAERECRFYLATKDTKAINNFFRAITHINPDFEDKIPEIEERIGINLREKQPMPTWIKTGEFNSKILRRPVSKCNRDERELISIVKYNQGNSPITQVTLIAYSDQAVRLDMKILDPNLHSDLKNRLALENFTPFSNTEGHLGIELPSSFRRSERFDKLLSLLKEFVNIDVIEGELKSYEASIMQRTIYAAVMHCTFLNKNTKNSPALADNLGTPSIPIGIVNTIPINPAALMLTMK